MNVVEVKEEKSDNVLGNIKILSQILDKCMFNNMAQVCHSTAEFEKDEPKQTS